MNGSITTHYNEHYIRQVHAISLLVTLLVLLALISGCSAGSQIGGTTAAVSDVAKIAIRIKWPTAKSRLIPQATQSIIVSVATQDDPSTVIATATIARGQTTATIAPVPAGYLIVYATAQGANGNAVASGNQYITTAVGQTNQLSISLATTIDHLIVSPSQSFVVLGHTVQLFASGVDASGATVLLTPSLLTWHPATSADATILAVTPTTKGGTATGRALGTGHIEVTDSESGKSGTCTLTVLPDLGPVTIYAGTTSGLAESTDGGASWPIISSDYCLDGTSNVRLNRSFPIPPCEPTSIAASGSLVCFVAMTGIEVSTDAGSSWTNYTTANGLAGDVVHQVAISGNEICAATTTGLSVSNNGGSSWTNYNSFTVNGFSNPSLNCVAVSNGTICVGLYYGIAVSSNNGSSWTEYLPNKSIVGIAVSGSTICAASDIYGLFVSTNGGGSWINYTSRNGLTDEFEPSVTLSGSTICAATDSGLWVSRNTGLSWTTYSTANGLASSVIFQVAMSGSTIYTATQSGLSVSTDGGSSWTNFTPAGPSSGLVLSVAVSSGSPIKSIHSDTGLHVQSLAPGTSVRGAR